MSQKDRDPRFRTHIAEPRWQQAASIIAVLVLAGLWLWMSFFAAK